MSRAVDTFSQDMVLSPAGLSFLFAVGVVNRVKSDSHGALSEFEEGLFSRVPFFEVFYTNVVMLAPRVVFLACAFVAVLITPDYTRHLERSVAGVAATIALIGISIIGLIDPFEARDLVISELGELTRSEDPWLNDYRRGIWVISEGLRQFAANLIS